MEWRYVTGQQATVVCYGAHVMKFHVPQITVNINQRISNTAEIRRIDRLSI
jgi:hypothetical protein